MANKFGAMLMPHHRINANAAAATLPADPGPAGVANNGAQERAVLQQCYVAAAAMAGVGPPEVVDEVDSAAMHWNCHVKNIAVIDEINQGFL
jgi:hypothetical protein